MRNLISLVQNGKTLAEQTETEDGVCWTIYNANPTPGPAILQQRGGWTSHVTVQGVVNGVLIVVKPSGLLSGIAWKSNGDFLTNYLRNSKGDFISKLENSAVLTDQSLLSDEPATRTYRIGA